MKAWVNELKNSLDLYKAIDPKARMIKIKNIDDHTGYNIAEELRLNDGRYFTAVYDLVFVKGVESKFINGEIQEYETSIIEEIKIVDLFIQVGDNLKRVSELPETVYDEMVMKIEIWHEENGEFPELSEI